MGVILNKIKKIDDFASLHELALEELDEIAGGRDIRTSENNDCSAVTKKLSKCIEHLSNDEAKPYVDKFWTGYKKWRAAIADAPEDSTDNYLSDFVDF